MALSPEVQTSCTCGSADSPPVHDVLSAREARALRQHVDDLDAALEERDRVLSMVAHDARNPIVAIAGHVGLLLAEPSMLSEEERQFSLETLQRQTDRLSALVDDLLTAQTLDGNALGLVIESVELRNAVELTVADVGLVGLVDVRVDERVVARADRRRLDQILSNLLTNAEQSGAPPIIVSAKQAGCFIELSIRDHGPGIAKEFIPVLFERFSRGSRQQHPSKRGTGLGLSIARDLARAQGGDVVYKEERSGGHFVVALPA